MHLDDETLQRLIDNELPRAAADAVREHIESCATCRDRHGIAAEEKAAVESRLTALDRPLPARAANARFAAPERPRTGRLLRLAAALLVAFGIAGAALAAPGSPIREIVQSLVRRLGGETIPRPPLSSGGDTASHPAKPISLSGISVAPGPTTLILFTAPRPGNRARVALTNGDRIEVKAPAGSATFTTEADRLVIDNREGPATFEILVPLDAPFVEIRLGHRTLFLKDDSRITAAESLLSGTGPFPFDLAR